MVKIALLFPGQGAQRIGMGKDFYERFPEARAVIDRADSILGQGLKDVMFNGPAEKLTSTAYCQPAILTMSLAALAALKASGKIDGTVASFAAGLSLGEYSALTAAGALSLDDALRLVERRSFFMEEATRQNAGKMAAVIGLEKEIILEICDKTGAEVANFNSPQQIVVSGHARKVELACDLLREAGAKSVIPLDVSGAFHSSLMRPAAERFGPFLKNVKINPTEFPVISNVDAGPETDPETIRANLARQITGSVQWVETIRSIAREGVSEFFEIGPGTVLKGLVKRIDKALKVTSVETVKDLEAVSSSFHALS